MSKVAIALGSLVIGILVGRFCGRHESIVQPVLAAQGVSLPDFIPKVRPLGGIKQKGNSFGHEVQQLDGMDCANCVFDSARLEYSGGAFRLENATFKGPFQLTLKGAAANTAELLRTIPALAKASLGKTPRPKPPIPNTPVHKAVPFTNTIRDSVNSPFGQK